MRIYTDHTGLIYANAISRTGDGRDVNGRMYQLCAGPTLVSLNFQSQPTELGANGVTNEALLAVLVHRLGLQQGEWPCDETLQALEGVTSALHALKVREERLRATRNPG